MTIIFLQGDASEALAEIPPDTVDCCVTSPPYWGLRDYGVEGQIGREATVEEYIGRLVEVFRKVRAALKPTGTLWLNLGDAYARNGGKGRPGPGASCGNTRRGVQARCLEVPQGYKSKDLLGLPWRVAFALQADGWYLRSDIIWHKPNAMPESVTDRPTRAHEYLFLLSRSERYYYNHKAIMTPLKESSAARLKRGIADGHKHIDGAPGQPPHSMNRPRANTRLSDGGAQAAPEGANKRSVWSVPLKGYRGAHFATFPLDLVKPCILAGSPKNGLVLDPFAGAGTVGVAAKLLGRRAVMIELNPAFSRMAEERVAKAAVQEVLFEAES